MTVWSVLADVSVIVSDLFEWVEKFKLPTAAIPSIPPSPISLSVSLSLSSLFCPSFWPICVSQTLPPLPLFFSPLCLFLSLPSSLTLTPFVPSYWVAVVAAGLEGSGQLFPQCGCVWPVWECVWEKVADKAQWSLRVCVSAGEGTHSVGASTGHVVWSSAAAKGFLFLSFSFSFFWFHLSFSEFGRDLQVLITGIYTELNWRVLVPDLVLQRDYASFLKESQPWQLCSDATVWWVLCLQERKPFSCFFSTVCSLRTDAALFTFCSWVYFVLEGWGFWNKSLICWLTENWL